MSYSSENGYTPVSVETIMLAVMAGVNTQFGTTYTAETFIGTGLYKFYYALVQRLQENEVKTSEIFSKLQDYFAFTNERISRPIVTNPGLLEYFMTFGYLASIKKPIDADAGKIFVCVDVDDNHARGKATITNYANLVSGTADRITVGATQFIAQSGAATLGTATFQAATSNSATAISLAAQINAHATAGALVEASAFGAVVTIRAKAVGTGGNSIALIYTNNDVNVGATVSGATLLGGDTLGPDDTDYDDTKLEIATIIKTATAGGVVSQGDEVETIVLTNGQAFDFKFYLPTLIEPLLRLTTVLSENNQVVIKTPDEQKTGLLANILLNYRLGKNFEPQRYYSLVDAPWAASVKLEYSLDGGTTWVSTIYDAEFNEKFDIKLGNITLVES